MNNSEVLTSQDVVYLSGAISINPMYEFDFFQAQHYLERRYNCKVINPATEAKGLSYEEYMVIDTAKVYACTHVVVIDDQNGAGTQYELEKAKEFGKTILHIKNL